MTLPTYVRTYSAQTRLTEPGNANGACYHYSSRSHPRMSTHWVVHHYRGIPAGVCLAWPAVYVAPLVRLLGSSPIGSSVCVCVCVCVCVRVCCLPPTQS